MTIHPLITNTNFTKYANEISRDGHSKAMGGSAFLVWFNIGCNLNDEASNYTECHYSFEKLKELTGLSPETISTAVLKLENLGYLTVKRVKEAKGFKERFIYSIPNLPKTVAEKSSKKKGGDTKKATEARLKPVKEKKARVEAAKTEITPQSELYSHYLKLHTFTSLDLWSEESFYRSNVLKEALKENTLEEIEEAFRWAVGYINRLAKTGKKLPNVKDYILKPKNAIQGKAAFEEAAKVEAKRVAVEAARLQQDLQQEQDKEQEKAAREKLRPLAIQMLKEEGQLTDKEIMLSDNKEVDFSTRAAIRQTISKKISELYQMPQAAD